MKLHKMFARASVSALALAAVTPAFAQSTGSQTFDQQQIVVTGRQAKDVGGVEVQNTPKARAVLTQEFIKRQTPGQSVDDIINYMPGVSFQNNDPYGASGGTLTIHGFDSSRISQTWDGIPLNDSGNYALYSNQQLDMELISEVNVSLGSTDIDSPTAAATGSTVNYVTRNPTEDFHARLEGSFGEYDYYRMFGVIDTGDFTKYGTRAFISASHQDYFDPYNHADKVDKSQFNAKLYQPLGGNGDFVSIAANYNDNKNNNFGDPQLTDASGAPGGFLNPGKLNGYSYPSCQTNPGHGGVVDAPSKDSAGNVCGSVYDYSYNPSHTGNVRINSKFTLAPGLILTVDPSYQFVKANGGSSGVTGYEGSDDIHGKYDANAEYIYGYIGGHPYLGGVDLNGDGDVIDTPYNCGTPAKPKVCTAGVELYAPSNTMTNRYGVIANLIYEISPTQEVRVNYSLDHARHRQTGEVGYLQPNGYAENVFPIDNPILDPSGQPIEKRNRLSYAILNQVAGQYQGKFFDDRLTLQAGVRAPFFTRDLNNYCVTEAGGKGYVDCFNDPASQATFLAANPSYTPPEKRDLHYSKVLPSAGFTYNFTPVASLFFDYSEGLQVPGTDDLYNAFSFAADSSAAKPKPETTDNFEGGVRYRSGKVQAELSGWYTFYKNRLASSYDPIQDVTVYRNLGTVHKYGVDGSVSYQPVRKLTLYAFGSYLKSKILDNVQTGSCTSTNVTDHDSAGVGTCTAVDQPIYALTAGKRESGSPVYTFGGRAQGHFGPLELGVQAKRTGPRYVNDQNLPVTIGGAVVYGAKTPAYTVVDLDARLSLGFAGLNDETYLQLNVTNLFNKFYVAGFTGNLSNMQAPYAYLSAPRAISGTVNFAF